MNPRLAALIPPLALALFTAVAAVSTAAVRAEPRAAVYERTRALAQALAAGDADTVLAMRQRSDTRGPEAEALAEIEADLEPLRGRPYLLTALEAQPDGSFEARIRWPAAARGYTGVNLTVRWVRGPDGVWRLS